MITTLRDSQRWLASVIQQPERLESAAREIEARIDVGDPDTAATRLGAYANGYPARIGEALSEAYPAVKHIVGDHGFHALATRYLPHVPAGGYNLSDVGAELARFLAGDRLDAELPFLADLARLEWAVHRAFHARLLPPLDPAPLADWPAERWERAVISFQPGVELVRSDWPILDLWRARSIPRAEIDIQVEGAPQSVFVYRNGFKVVCEPLDADQAASLSLLLAGGTLGDVSHRLAESKGTAGTTSAWFARWMGRGLVTGCI